MFNTVERVIKGMGIDGDLGKSGDEWRMCKEEMEEGRGKGPVTDHELYE